jgi:DNA invertase Pin-like site-specific DNA recombinase
LLDTFINKLTVINVINISEREKAGFEKKKDDTDEWQEYERKLKEEAEKREKELKEDELYDNLKTAFK